MRRPLLSILALLAASTVPLLAQVPLNLTLVNNPANSSFGQPVTLTVTANQTITGSITFFEVFSSGRTPIGSATLSNNSATLTISTLAAGTHQLNASFQNSFGQVFTSNTVTQTVSGATSLNLTSQPDPSVFGQAVTLTATITPSAATGTISFFDVTSGSLPLGSATLSNGVATLTTTSIPAGTRTLSATYPGNNNFTSSTGRTTHSVTRAPSTISLSSSPNPSGVGQLVVITAALPGAATGTVTFFDGSATLSTAQAGQGSAATSSATLTEGSHSLSATYNGDNNFLPSNAAPITQVVGRAATTTSLSANPNPANLGQTVTLTANVTPSNATGSVTFLDGTNQIGAADLGNGSATLQIATLAAGPHTLTARYNGDNLRAPSTSSPVTLTINQSTSLSLAATPNPASVGQAVTLTASATPASTTGTVQFLDGTNPIGTAALVNGTASISVSTLAAGTHTLRATLGQTASNTVTLTVNKLPTTTSLSASPTAPTVGQAVTLTANVSPSNATGTVAFADGTNPIGTATVINGTATLSVSTLAAGNHSLSATYSGDNTFNASTSSIVPLTVGQASTATTTNLSVSPNPATVGQQVTLSALVVPSGATGTVTFRDGTNPIGQATLSNGTATLVSTFSTAGTHGLTASYAGDSAFSGSTSAPVSLVVGSALTPTQTSLSASPNPASLGQTVTLNAVVSPPGATGTVTFRDGNATLGTATLSNGSAAITVSSLTPGNHTLTASYGGDTTNSPSTSSPIVEVISSTPASVTLTASPNPSPVGQPVSLTVTVVPPTATGSVTIFDAFNSTFLVCLVGTDCVLRNGVAILTTSSLAAGTHSLQAFYGGDANTPAMESNIFQLTITPVLTPTTTTLTAPASGIPGQTVTMNATVTGSGATGFVLFKEGDATLGTVALTNGSASFSTTSLTTGPHTVVASYSGDSRFAASTSNAVTITIGATPCVPFPNGFVPFSSVFSISQPNGAGDRLLIGSMTAADLQTYRALPLPAAANQQFCGTVLLAPGVAAIAYVPTSAERAGDFSSFGGAVTDPTNNQPFPGGIIPVGRIPGVFAARIVAVLPNPTLTLTASPTQSGPGQPVTLTATTVPAAATGTITFSEGGTALGTASLANGTATLSISTLTAGAHSITATYGGDAQNGPATSNTVTVTVTSPLTPTQTVLSASPSPSTAGQAVTLTAAVTPAAATGSVTFRDGTTALGNANLSNGTATLTTTALSAGGHSLTATYNGDSARAPSTSAAITLTVNPGTPVQITTTALTGGFVNVPYTQTLTATGGTGTLTWSLAAGSAPGLTLSAGGVLAGTPTAAGNSALTIRVQDTVGQANATVLTLIVNPAVPPVSISVTQPTTITDQPAPQASLTGYPVALNGTYRLTFTPNAAGLPTPFNNTAVQFITGGTSATVSMPSNATAPVALPAVQLGNVAGTITVQLATLTVAGTGQAVPLPAAPPSTTITVPRLAPVIMANSVRITNVTATGFQVVLNAVSTPRDLVSGSFTFSPASGGQLTGTSFPAVSLTAAAATWFAPANSDATTAGGAFSLTIPFTYSGDTSALGTVSATLTNTVGTSAAVSGGR